MENIWICVYRDTIEEHDESSNLSEVLVEKDFAEQYFNECVGTEWFENFEAFLNEYIADDTEDFYEYAIKHNAIIGIEHWTDENCMDKLKSSLAYNI